MQISNEWKHSLSVSMFAGQWFVFKEPVPCIVSKRTDGGCIVSFGGVETMRVWSELAAADFAVDHIILGELVESVKERRITPAQKAFCNKYLQKKHVERLNEIAGLP